MLSWPTRIPISIAPMLLDFASTVFIGTTPMPRWESWIMRPGSLSTPPWQLIGDSGFRLVVSSAAERLITLNTEPGSNGTDTAWFMRFDVVSPGCGGRFGLYDG